jgi:anti-sigma regulatory factor (Ser/Thr protein kinase)
MRPHLAVPVHEPSQVGEARREALRLAADLGFDETTSGRLALVVTELGNNLAHHAVEGRLLLGVRAHQGADQVEVLSLDRGPGMADLDRCLSDGYSTRGTPGTGLGAVRRLSDRFSIYSRIGQGTIIVAGVAARLAATAATRAEHGFAWAGVALAAPGELVSGDGWAVSPSGDQVSVMVVDGLGHGPDAAQVADSALREFDARPAGTPAAVLGRLHEALRGTRGAAAAVASLDAAAGSIVFAGAGNIAGRIISGTEDRSLLSQHGTVGVQVRRTQDLHYPWPDHAILVLHSDGVATRWTLEGSAGLLRCDLAVIAAWLIRDHSRGRDDATVVVIGRK